MDVYKINDINELLQNNPYPGRGIIVGTTPDGTNACTAYFIMGRSENSRNRIFAKEGEDVFTKPFDETKVEDPSLIIYAAIRKFENYLIVTNGDQTDTVYEALKAGITFDEGLKERCFEPDGPNFTPRISALLSFEDETYSYKMSILKSIDEEGSNCARYYYEYPSINGLGHFIHTYVTDGNPLPTFCGEPERIKTDNDIEKFSNDIWNALNDENKISLYVRYIDIKTGETKEKLINKNT